MDVAEAVSADGDAYVDDELDALLAGLIEKESALPLLVNGCGSCRVSLVFPRSQARTQAQRTSSCTYYSRPSGQGKLSCHERSMARERYRQSTRPSLTQVQQYRYSVCQALDRMGVTLRDCLFPRPRAIEQMESVRLVCDES